MNIENNTILQRSSTQIFTFKHGVENFFEKCILNPLLRLHQKSKIMCFWNLLVLLNRKVFFVHWRKLQLNVEYTFLLPQYCNFVFYLFRRNKLLKNVICRN